MSERFGSTCLMAALLCCGGLSPAVALAQRAVLLPVAGRPDLVAQHGDEAVAMMRTVLESASLEPMSASEARAAMVSAGAEPCDQPACVPAMLRTLDAVMGAGVAIWPHEAGLQVAIVLVDPEGRQANGSRELPVGTSVRDSVVEATDAALASWAVRNGAAVRVVGTPNGASITVDRVLWGTIPYEGTLSPGEHRFVVSAAGHESERRTVPIQMRIDGAAEELRFDLSPSSTASSSGGIDNLALGLGIGIPAVVAGITLVVVGAVREAEGRQCASPSCDPTVPVEARFVSDPTTGLNVGLVISGSVLVIAGGIVMGALCASGSSSAQAARRWTDGTRIFF